jgi:hypothetical protein
MSIRHNERFLIPMIDAFDLHQLRQAAAARTDQVLDARDWQGALTWHRILDAIERLQAKAPAEDEQVH